MVAHQGTPAETPGVIGIADNHTVFGSWYRSDTATPSLLHWNFRWTPGAPTIVYPGDSFTLPTAFVKKSDFGGNYSGSAFYGSYVSRTGDVYGTGVCYRRDYDTLRTVEVWSPGKNRTAIPDYAPSAYSSAMHFLNLPDHPPKLGSMSWPGRLSLVNNNGDMIYHYDGLHISGDAPTAPSPAVGNYFSPSLQVGLPLDQCVGMNDQKHVLATSGIYALESPAPAWKPVGTPRLSFNGALPQVNWIAFNNRLQAIGRRFNTSGTAEQHVVLINDHDYLLENLLPPSWKLLGLNAINDEGMILATAKELLDGSGNPIPDADQVPCVVLLLPIEIFPDDGMAGVVGDVVPSVKGPRGDKHFVSPKLTPAIPNTHVFLKKAGISDGFFQQYCEWGLGGEAVDGQPLKRKVSRAAPDMKEVTIKLTSTGQILAQIKVWIVWASGAPRRESTPFFSQQASGGFSWGEFGGPMTHPLTWSFVFTIQPAAIISPSDSDRPNLTGGPDPDHKVPGAKNFHSIKTTLPADEATYKWDSSRQMRRRVTLHGVTQTTVPFPADDVEGYDDPVGHGNDEEDIPYHLFTEIPSQRTELDHAFGALSSADGPRFTILNCVGVTDGETYRSEADFREFARVQLWDRKRSGGKFWFRISDDVPWHHYLRAKFKKHWFSPNEWEDDGSIDGLGNATP